jgi:hypothetical protein
MVLTPNIFEGNGLSLVSIFLSFKYETQFRLYFFNWGALSILISFYFQVG